MGRDDGMMAARCKPRRAGPLRTSIFSPLKEYLLLPEATAVHGEATRSQPLREHPLNGTRPHRLARMHAAGIDTATGIGVVPQERVA
eukprot:scaffold40578_cov69-Phaeocystis_antarctica.AAC.3